MKIREAQALDWPDIYQLIEDNMYQMQKALGLSWDKGVITQHCQSKSVLIGEHEGEILGFIAYGYTNNQPFIHSLQVAKKHQNRLYGFRLFKAVISEAKRKGSNVIKCSVFANNQAKEIYRNHSLLENNDKVYL